MGMQSAEGTHVRNSPLTSIIPHQSRPGSIRARRGDIDHAPAIPLLEELGNYGLGSVEDTFDVDVEDALPFCFGDFEGWLYHSLTQHPKNRVQTI